MENKGKSKRLLNFMIYFMAVAIILGGGILTITRAGIFTDETENSETLYVDGDAYKCVSGASCDIEPGDKIIYESMGGNYVMVEVDHVSEGRAYFDPGGHDPEWDVFTGVKTEDVYKVIDPE